MSALSTIIHLVSGKPEHRKAKMFLIEAETAEGVEIATTTHTKSEMYQAVKDLIQDDYTDFLIHEYLGLGEYKQIELEQVLSALRHPARQSKKH
jgi:hypothetical protein